MNCMKCGRETEQERVFCPDCLREMEKHPVRPETVVLLPKRKEVPVVKKTPKRHVSSIEEQNKQLRKWLTILSAILAVCVLLIILMIKPTMHYIFDEHVEIGQNYSSVIPTVPTSTSNSLE